VEIEQYFAVRPDIDLTLKKVNMDWKLNDWVEHSAFGVGQVIEDRVDKVDVHFVTAGKRTLVKSANLVSATPPSPGFRFPTSPKKSRTSRFTVERPPVRPRLDFEHFVACFKNRFPEGFDGQDFEKEEREYKQNTAKTLKQELAKDAFEKLLGENNFNEICKIAKKVLQKTNLAYPIEKARLVDGIKIVENQEPFAKVLYELLHHSDEMELSFTRFSDVLSQIGANSWPIATYYQFLKSDGEWMLLKPSIMKRMADSLNFSLNYKPEPNWPTYLKLQELANQVEFELRKRELIPHSRIDVQSFIFASIWIEEGKY
jgi:hypothetical protein